MSQIGQLRTQFHKQVCQQSIYLKGKDIPSIADVGSKLSTQLARNILIELGHPVSSISISGQTAGARFEQAVREYLAAAFVLLGHLRPARWQYSIQGNISNFAQYQHLSELNALIKQNKVARTALGDYLVTNGASFTSRIEQ